MVGELRLGVFTDRLAVFLAIFLRYLQLLTRKWAFKPFKSINFWLKNGNFPGKLSPRRLPDFIEFLCVQESKDCHLRPNGVLLVEKYYYTQLAGASIVRSRSASRSAPRVPGRGAQKTSFFFNKISFFVYNEHWSTVIPTGRRHYFSRSAVFFQNSDDGIIPRQWFLFFSK